MAAREIHPCARHRFQLTAALLLQLAIAAVSAEQWILQLTTYESAVTHIKTVEELLRGFDVQEFAVGSRAVDYPTDFVVVTCSENEMANVQSKLMALESVRRVTRDSPFTNRKLLAPIDPQAGFADRDEADDLFNVSGVHAQGILGQGVRIAIFDSGVSVTWPFNHMASVTGWTSDGKVADGIGHGSFVAGIVAGKVRGCPGLAPEAEIHSLRVFTDSQKSYTSWFLDAFNYAMHIQADIVNLSIGGPDHGDRPFLDKINEVSAAGIVIVSAIGNDGPMYGSLNNPADMMEVIGVGGIEFSGSTSPFSSRGMTTHELQMSSPNYGRVKPDLVTIARDLKGPGRDFRRCVTLSGTSVASPVVAGAIALLLSAISSESRKAIANPASVKRALIRSAKRIPQSNQFEQGAGILDIPAAVKEMQQMDEEHRQEARGGIDLQLFPFFLDFTKSGCPYMWPFCTQSFYATMQPLTVNVTILNPNSVVSKVTTVSWNPGTNGEHIVVDSFPPERFWPWSGGLGLRFRVRDGDEMFQGICEGLVNITVESIPTSVLSIISLPVRMNVETAPPKNKRVLWDIGHNLMYPPAYIPGDDLQIADSLDWLGDHPHTNHRGFLRALVDQGFRVELWDQPLNCLLSEDASRYGFLIVVDPEEEFSVAEVNAFQRIVRDDRVHAVVAGDWYSPEIIESISFGDESTKSVWRAVGGGANIPALNRLLKSFGISFGDRVFEENLRYPFNSGTSIIRFPADGYVIVGRSMKERRKNQEVSPAVVGITRSSDRGNIIAFGDSSCLDADMRGSKCYNFFVKAMLFLFEDKPIEELDRNFVPANPELFAVEKVAEEIPKSIWNILKPHLRSSQVDDDNCGELRHAVRASAGGAESNALETIAMPDVQPAILPKPRKPLGKRVSLLGPKTLYGALLVVPFLVIIGFIVFLFLGRVSSGRPNPVLTQAARAMRAIKHGSRSRRRFRGSSDPVSL